MMTNKEAIKQIEWYFEEDDGIGADTKTKQAFNITIDAIKKLSEIEDIISCPLPIQEDVLRYKAICEVIRK